MTAPGSQDFKSREMHPLDCVFSFGVARTVLKQSLAYAQKDISQSLRFKFGFISGLFLPVLINFVLFGTIFFGFFKAGTSGSAELNSGNFVAFTLLGALSATLFNLGYNSFQSRFSNEKYWQTALGILASPMSPWAILFGLALSDAISFSTVAAIFLIFSDVFLPVGVGTLFGSVVLLLLLYLMVSGLSIIRGALFLVNENVDAPLGYFILGTSYISCFYYPTSFLPSFLRDFALINPVYYVVYSLRSLWLGLPIESSYWIVAVVLAFLSPVIGTYVFRKVWRNLDITGY